MSHASGLCLAALAETQIVSHPCQELSGAHPTVLTSLSQLCAPTGLQEGVKWTL